MPTAIGLEGAIFNRQISSSEIESIRAAINRNAVSSTWGKIKDWFCGTHKEEAKLCLYHFFSSEKITDKKIYFDRLKNLSSETFKHYFRFDQHGNEANFSIGDFEVSFDNGGVDLSNYSANPSGRSLDDYDKGKLRCLNDGLSFKRLYNCLLTSMRAIIYLNTGEKPTIEETSFLPKNEVEAVDTLRDRLKGNTVTEIRARTPREVYELIKGYPPGTGCIVGALYNHDDKEGRVFGIGKSWGHAFVFFKEQSGDVKIIDSYNHRMFDIGYDDPERYLGIFDSEVNHENMITILVEC